MTGTSGPNWFVGIPIDAGDWFAPFVLDAPRSVRVFHAEDLHATVAFLGPCGQDRALAAFDAAEGFSHEEIPARLGRLEALGDPRRPSALSLGFDEGRAEAASVIGRLRDEMASVAGAERDRRPPLPHVTVARIGRDATASARRDALAWAKAKPAAMANVALRELALFTAAEDRRERLFRRVRSRPLSA